eukprot:1122145-Prymnesium_polylepis.1
MRFCRPSGRAALHASAILRPVGHGCPSGLIVVPRPSRDISRGFRSQPGCRGRERAAESVLGDNSGSDAEDVDVHAELQWQPCNGGPA